jgi:hypothetical protein
MSDQTSTQSPAHKQLTDVPEFLAAALDLAIGNFATDAECTVEDVRSELERGEWELALGILVDLKDAHSQPVRFWKLLANAAELMHLDRSLAWCRWRGWEALNGVIRADLVLDATEAGGRRSVIPGAGVLRPMWDIGHRTNTGEPTLAIARIWVECATALAPGERGPVRLTPLNPSGWRHLAPGSLITMHEAAPPVGLAEIIDVLPPADA